MGASSSPVPCGSCSLCCHGKIFLSPGEDDRGLPTVWDQRLDGRRLRRLIMRKDGSCSHLIDGRCSVYAQRPDICSGFDCRDHYALPSAERRRREALLTSPGDRAVIARGRELVEQGRKP